MKLLKILRPDEALAEIRRLYFNTRRQTVDADFARAIDLLKALPTEEDRERATVYMEGIAQMRREWAARAKRQTRRGPKK
jgi:hypothetical protein